MKYKITDIDELYAAHPAFFTKKEVIILDRRKVTHALKAGFTLPGVEVEEEKAAQIQPTKKSA